MLSARSLPTLPTTTARFTTASELGSVFEEPGTSLEQNDANGGGAKESEGAAGTGPGVQEWHRKGIAVEAHRFGPGVPVQLAERQLLVQRRLPGECLPANWNRWLLFHDDPNVPENRRRSIPSYGRLRSDRFEGRRGLSGVRSTSRGSWIDRKSVPIQLEQVYGLIVRLADPLTFTVCWGRGATRTWSPTKALSPNVRKIAVFVKDRIHGVETIGGSDPAPLCWD